MSTLQTERSVIDLFHLTLIIFMTNISNTKEYLILSFRVCTNASGVQNRLNVSVMGGHMIFQAFNTCALNA